MGGVGIFASRVAALACLGALALVPAAGAQGPEPRIVGGQATTIEEWPWQVAIADPPSSGGDGYDRQFCGGSLVAPTLVLTAAHCVYDSGFQPPEEFSVITGRTTLSSSQGAEIPPVELYYFVSAGGVPTAQAHGEPSAGPQLYDDDTGEWDVALLELAGAAPPPAAPIQIAGASERGLWDPGDPAFITGWGSMATLAGPYPDDLQEAEVEIVSDADCKFAYGEGFHRQTMVCAGVYPEGGRDTCQGDSGGPLVVPAGGGAFRLVGDTSFGLGCATPGFPGIYGRLADDPMRSALEAAVAAIAGVDVTGEDATPPQTTIRKHPRKRTTRRRARFTFTASEEAVFRCRLDRGRFRPCSSPYRKRVRRGRHTFRVFAIDRGGNVDPTPAKFRWKVPRRR